MSRKVRDCVPNTVPETPLSCRRLRACSYSTTRATAAAESLVQSIRIDWFERPKKIGMYDLPGRSVAPVAAVADYEQSRTFSLALFIFNNHFLNNFLLLLLLAIV